MANGRLTTFIRDRETGTGYGLAMPPVFISNRTTLTDASDLIERYGDDAFAKAAAFAAQSRNAGNVKRFCHWRQIQRVIATLSGTTITGSVH